PLLPQAKQIQTTAHRTSFREALYQPQKLVQPPQAFRRIASNLLVRPPQEAYQVRLRRSAAIHLPPKCRPSKLSGASSSISTMVAASFFRKLITRGACG